MNAKTLARYEARARIFKALAHPARLYMVEMLSQGERCVSDLTEEVGADMSTVSKHLAVLKGAGIVATQKRGLTVYYRLRMPCVLKTFGCIETVLASNAKEQAELVG